MTFVSLFFLGLSYGSTACMFSCMPFLSPLLVTNSQSIKHSMALIVPFSLGRIFAYMMISLIALGSAGFIKAVLDDNTVFQILLGIFTLVMGLWMLLKAFRRNTVCSGTSLPKKLASTSFGLFSIGVLISINPCAPLLTLITLSAGSTSLVHAIGIGVSFGMGAVLVPLIFYGFFLSGVMRGLLLEFKSYAKQIEIAAAMFLMAAGLLIISTHTQF